MLLHCGRIVNKNCTEIYIGLIYRRDGGKTEANRPDDRFGGPIFENQMSDVFRRVRNRMVSALSAIGIEPDRMHIVDRVFNLF
jgi:hypothetical protein